MGSSAAKEGRDHLKKLFWIRGGTLA